MPMGVVDDDAFEREVSSLSKPLPPPVTFNTPLEGEVIDAPNKGRGEGNVGVPDSLRRLIGEEAAINGRNSALSMSNEFGISSSSTSAYGHSSNSTSSYHQANPSIKSGIQKARERISRRARGVLNRSIDNITDKKLEASKAIELATIARNMSSIVKDMEEDNQVGKNGTSTSAPAIVIIAPAPIQDLSRFERIVVRE